MATHTFPLQFETKSNVDNWGDPKLTTIERRPRAPPDYYENFIRQPCEAQWKENLKPMSDLFSNATAIHSLSNEKYDNFDSIDLIPENKKLYPKGSPWGAKYQYPAKKIKSILASTCHLDEDNGRQWEIARIGPFTTTGGYDWVQIGWDDLWGFSKILKDFPEGVFLLKQHMTPVLKDGTRIGFPPIHIHHIHVGPPPYVRQRSDPVSCAFKGERCWSPARTAEVHGDYVCFDDEGGHDCHLEDYPEGYGKFVKTPLGIEGELNDVRSFNSEPLEWYWEMGIQWIPNVASESNSLPKHLSLQNFGGPGTYDPSVQRSYLLTFPTPTQSESMFWYTGRMSRAGELLRMKLHAHNTVFEESMFFAATPEDLGLFEQHGFSRMSPSHALLPGEVGFENNAMLREYIFSSLIASQQRGKEKGLSEPDLPRIVCHSISRLEIIDGFAYDRRSPTSCDEWSWEAGDIFTVIGFNKWHGYPLGQHQPSLEAIPPFLAGHVGYWLSYDSHETPPTSHWGYSLFNHYPDGGINDVLQMEGYQKVSWILNGYTSPHFHDWSKTPNALFGYVIFKAVRNLFITFLIILLLFVYGIYLLYHLWIKMSKETMKHKKDDEIMLCDNGTKDFFTTNFTSLMKDFLKAIRSNTNTAENHSSSSVEVEMMSQSNEEKQSLLTGMEE